MTDPRLLSILLREGSEVWMIDAAVIEKLQFEELPDLRDIVPEGGVNELLAFIQGLREFRRNGSAGRRT